MNQTKYVVSACAVVALGATLLFACTAGVSISDGPTYNYGAQPLGSVQTKVFTLSNASAEDVTLGTVSGAALGLRAPFSLTGGTCASGRTLAAGSDCTLAVAFSPTAAGLASDSIDLTYRSGSSSTTVSRPIRGIGGAAIAVSDGPTFDFGIVGIGLVRKHTFRFTNLEVTDVILTDLSSAGLGLSAPFSGSASCPGGKIAANGGTCSIEVAFSPTTSGVSPGQLTVGYRFARDEAPNELLAIAIRGDGIGEGLVSNFTGPGINEPQGIIAGPDGNLWFTNYRGNSIGRVTPSGVVSNFSDPVINGPGSITLGPDGNLWFTNGTNNSIGRITPSGVVSSFTGAGISFPGQIVAGPDGNLWFTNTTIAGSSIGQMTTAGVLMNIFVDGILPMGIASGPDGNVWFTVALDTPSEQPAIVRISPGGIASKFMGPEMGHPMAIAVGANNSLWFTEYLDDSIGRITTTGIVSRFAAPWATGAPAIAAGPDKNLWFANNGTDSIGRITPAGVVTTLAVSEISKPFGITPGPDGNVWFTNVGSNSIGRINLDKLP